jgi:Ca2+-binding RTX toxin-like protein
VIDARGLTVAVEVFGGAGDDALRGGRGADLLHGGDGDDVLRGGERRDVIVGGAGRDQLFGGGDDDILIAGGLPDAEGDTAAAKAFRDAVLAVWTTPRTAAERLTTLAAGTDATGVFLDATNALDDAAADLLSGNAGTDWLFGASEPDKVRDRFKATLGEDEFTEIG